MLRIIRCSNMIIVYFKKIYLLLLLLLLVLYNLVFFHDKLNLIV